MLRVVRVRSDLHDTVLKRADSGDVDAHDIVGLERELIGRHDPGAGEEDRAVREALAAEEKLGEFGKGPFDLAHARRALERDRAGAPDREAAIQILTGPLVGKEFPLHNNATTVGKAGSEVAVISRTPQGYFLTHIEGGKFPVVNGSTIESRARQLANRDVIEVAGVKMVFFYK